MFLLFKISLSCILFQYYLWLNLVLYHWKFRGIRALPTGLSNELLQELPNWFFLLPSNLGCLMHVFLSPKLPNMAVREWKLPQSQKKKKKVLQSCLWSNPFFPHWKCPYGSCRTDAEIWFCRYYSQVFYSIPIAKCVAWVSEK